MPTGKLMDIITNRLVIAAATLAFGATAGSYGTSYAADERYKTLIEDNPAIITLQSDVKHLTEDFKEFKADYKDDQHRASDERDAILKAVEAR